MQCFTAHKLHSSLKAWLKGHLLCEIVLLPCSTWMDIILGYLKALDPGFLGPMYLLSDLNVSKTSSSTKRGYYLYLPNATTVKILS